MKINSFYALENQYLFLLFFIALHSVIKFLNSGKFILKKWKLIVLQNLTKKAQIYPNPFEIVEMIRRANSLNDATEPSDARWCIKIF